MNYWEWEKRTCNRLCWELARLWRMWRTVHDDYFLDHEHNPDGQDEPCIFMSVSVACCRLVQCPILSQQRLIHVTICPPKNPPKNLSQAWVISPVPQWDRISHGQRTIHSTSEIVRSNCNQPLSRPHETGNMDKNITTHVICPDPFMGSLHVNQVYVLPQTQVSLIPTEEYWV